MLKLKCAKIGERKMIEKLEPGGRDDRKYISPSEFAAKINEIIDVVNALIEGPMILGSDDREELFQKMVDKMNKAKIINQ
jgi:hypothetical protein